MMFNQNKFNLDSRTNVYLLQQKVTSETVKCISQARLDELAFAFQNTTFEPAPDAFVRIFFGDIFKTVVQCW